MAPVSLLIIGAGNRGRGYGRWALGHPERAVVTGVAEPHEARRASVAAEHQIGAGNAVADWRQLATRATFADAVLICTQDRMHAEPAEASAIS
jgi:predicted dehydrogenase